MSAAMDPLSCYPTREAVVSPLSDGRFRLLSAGDAHSLTPILFANRKAACNWALGKGYQVRVPLMSGGR